VWPGLVRAILWNISGANGFDQKYQPILPLPREAQNAAESGRLTSGRDQHALRDVCEEYLASHPVPPRGGDPFREFSRAREVVNPWGQTSDHVLSALVAVRGRLAPYRQIARTTLGPVRTTLKP
jgi:hypothetical protein